MIFVSKTLPPNTGNFHNSNVFFPLILGIHREEKVRRKLLILCYKKIWDEEYKSGMDKDKICNIK